MVTTGFTLVREGAWWRYVVRAEGRLIAEGYVLGARAEARLAAEMELARWITANTPHSTQSTSAPCSS